MHLPVLKVVARMTLRLSTLAIIPFLAAGQADWGNGWLLTALLTVNLVVVLPIVYKRNPEVTKLRMQPIRPTRGFDQVVNKFLHTTVSIQREREHRVVGTGPYRIVRHPMYSGLLLVYLSLPLILGSWWAFIPMGLMPPLLVFRTAKEDAALRAVRSWPAMSSSRNRRGIG